MLKMEKYVQSLDHPILLKEMIKIRSLQLNGCTCCLDMHTEEAIVAGENPYRICTCSLERITFVYTFRKSSFAIDGGSYLGF
jgi:AhpD family alkylhydroperoxidase